jgi:hypothetical protein
MWSAYSGELKTLEGHTQRVESVCFSPDTEVRRAEWNWEILMLIHEHFFAFLQKMLFLLDFNGTLGGTSTLQYLWWYAFYLVLISLFYFFSSPFTGNRELVSLLSSFDINPDPTHTHHLPPPPLPPPPPTTTTTTITTTATTTAHYCFQIINLIVLFPGID